MVGAINRIADKNNKRFRPGAYVTVVIEYLNLLTKTQMTKICYKQQSHLSIILNKTRGSSAWQYQIVVVKICIEHYTS